MKIARIFAHRVELPLIEGSYKWSGGKSVSVFDSTIVGVETACGVVGYGEVCPLGPFYLPAYAEGVRAGLRDLRGAPVPSGLLARLLDAPFPARRRPTWLLIGAPAAVAAIAIGIALYVSRPPPQPDEAQLAAMRELALAMRYLQRSAVIAEDEVNVAVTAGLLDAFRAGNIKIGDENSEDEDGG